MHGPVGDLRLRRGNRKDRGSRHSTGKTSVVLLARSRSLRESSGNVSSCASAVLCARVRFARRTRCSRSAAACVWWGGG
eukprot:362874-Chlamydomonas_euryale.AAC.3